jgi:hypothetical protein
MNLQERLCDWENLRLAYNNAARGKRGRGATAAFEMLLRDAFSEIYRQFYEGFPKRLTSLTSEKRQPRNGRKQIEVDGD